MRYCATADTDIGTTKSTNQDSALIKHAACQGNEVMMAIICDGMGGLAKGELASATVIRCFSEWFDKELPFELRTLDFNVIGEKWALMLKNLNTKIIQYSQQNGINSMGTTFSGILFAAGQYVIVHVGDSRIYHIGDTLSQLTEDQTFIAREIRRGTMTLEQAKTDNRRNLLLQCVGASAVVEPQILVGRVMPGTYMLCSDGFRHEISEQEIFGAFHPSVLVNKDVMHQKAKGLIDVNKTRRERDNITVVLVKAE